MPTSRDGPRGESLNVVVVCPYRLEGEGLRLALEQEEELTVAGPARNAAEAMELAHRQAADIIVMGWGWREQECMAAVKRFSAENGATPVLVIAADPQPAHVRWAVEAGVRGIVPANIEIDELIYTVRKTASVDEMILHRTLVPAFLAHVASGSDPEKPMQGLDSLTPRERDVLQLVARGLMDRSIGQTLFISVRTVQTHLSHIYAKLGVHTRTEAALMAVQAGWTPADPDGPAEPGNP